MSSIFPSDMIDHIASLSYYDTCAKISLTCKYFMKSTWRRVSTLSLSHASSNGKNQLIPFSANRFYNIFQIICHSNAEIHYLDLASPALLPLDHLLPGILTYSAPNVELLRLSFADPTSITWLTQVRAPFPSLTHLSLHSPQSNHIACLSSLKLESLHNLELHIDKLFNLKEILVQLGKNRSLPNIRRIIFSYPTYDATPQQTVDLFGRRLKHLIDVATQHASTLKSLCICLPTPTYLIDELVPNSILEAGYDWDAVQRYFHRDINFDLTKLEINGAPAWAHVQSLAVGSNPESIFNTMHTLDAAASAEEVRQMCSALLLILEGLSRRPQLFEVHCDWIIQLLDRLIELADASGAIYFFSDTRHQNPVARLFFTFDMFDALYNLTETTPKFARSKFCLSLDARLEGLLLENDTGAAFLQKLKASS